MKIILSVTILALHLLHVQACSCLQTTFEDFYCGSQLSVLGKVIARTDNCKGTCDPITDQGSGEIIYIVRVLRTFQGTPPEDDILYLRTRVNGALCGINVAVGPIFLFNLAKSTTRKGVCPSKVRSVSLCRPPVLWKSLAKKSKKFVFKNAKTGNSLC